jgi:phenylalanine-4-hydroxylase
MLARLFWFTVEFGLVDNGEGYIWFRIMSSGELVYAISDIL